MDRVSNASVKQEALAGVDRTDPEAADLASPGGGGELGKRIRAFDWSQTSLGPMVDWPQSLRTAADIVLHSPVAMVLLWGREGIMIYNDAYSIFAGRQHPRLLGLPVLEGWPEVAAFNAHVMDVGLRGETLSFESQHLILYRNGAAEDVWLDLNYSPVADESSKPAGVLAIVVETTERKRGEQELREREAELARVQKIGGVGGLEVDLRGGFRNRRSPEYLTVHGLPPDAKNESHEEWVRRIHPDDRVRVESNFREVVAGNATDYSAEYRIIRPSDGALRWISAKAVIERDEKGQPVRLIGAHTDITERRRIEDALRAADERIQLALDAGAVVGTWVWDIPNDRLTGDARFARTFSLDPEQAARGVTRKKALPQVYPDDVEPVQTAMRHAMKNGGPYRSEYRLRHADGIYRWIESNGQCELDADGNPARFAGVLIDINDRKQAETKLQQLNATLEHQVEQRTRERDRIWNNSNELMASASFDGALKSVNPAWTRMLGWDEATLLSRPFREFIHPDDIAIATAAIEVLARGDSVSRFEGRLLCSDGSHCLIAWNAAPWEGEFYAVGRDITDQREVEESLRQAQKMEAVGQLTGGIAHDFNNLLTGIVGALDLLRTRIGQGRFDSVDRYITAAMTSANRAAALTHRLLAFARRQPLDPKPVNANQMITSLEDLLRRTIGEQIQLEIVAAGGLWPTMCDPNQLENAIINLALNARDAMPDGGKLTIETANAHLDNSYAAAQRDVTPGQYVAICISDTGVGMNAAVIAQAFNPFFTTKPLGQGTGLGLSMIYGFAKQSEGHVRIYSEVGEGTTVKLYLPRYRGNLEDTTILFDEAPSQQDMTGEIVLVVEDEPIVRELVVDLLRDAGYHVLQAKDGPSGLVILESSQRLDLLITDVGLPGMNGRQLADHARASRPTLKVLFITGYAENAAFAGGFLAPGMEMLTKPFAMDALIDRVRDMIKRG